MYVVFLLIAGFFLDSTVFPVPLVFIFSLLLVRKVLENHDIKQRKSIGSIMHKSNELLFFFPLLLCLVMLFLIDGARLIHPGLSPLVFIVVTIGIVGYSRLFELSKSRFFVIYLFICVAMYGVIMRYNIMMTVLVLLAMMVIRLILFKMPKKNEKT